MFAQYSNRREFLKSGGLSLILLLNSCSNVSKKVNIALQNSFLPDSFKDIIPFAWEQKKINFGSNNLEKNKSINSTYNGIAFTVDMLNNNPDKVRLFALRSFGESLYHSITDASLEFGFETI